MLWRFFLFAGIACAAAPPASLHIGVWRPHGIFVYLTLPAPPPAGQIDAIQRAVGCRLAPEVDEGLWIGSGRCDAAVSRPGRLLARYAIPGSRLFAALQPMGIESIFVSADSGGAPYTDTRREIQRIDRAQSPPQIGITWGYRGGDAARLSIPFAVLILAAPGATFWLRTAALSVARHDPAAAWFLYCRSFPWIAGSLWILWFSFTSGAGVSDLLAFMGVPRFGAVRSLVDFAAPAAMQVICAWIAHPIAARIRGAEWRLQDTLAQGVWRNAAIVLPLLCLMAGFQQVIEDASPGNVILWMLAAAALFVFCMTRAARAIGWIPEAVTTGELRDRVFDLAAKAGLHLRQFYLLPAGRARMANAFASSHTQIFVTDYLLERLTRKEVDAVMAHEVAHLKERHPQRLAVVYATAITVPIAVVTLLLPKLVPPSLGIPAGVLGALLAGRTMSRRFERAADRGAVALGADPEALITGLVKLHRLGMLPVTWREWDERFMTHPSAARRAHVIAKAGGVSPERVEVLLAGGGEPGDHYVFPPVQERQGALYSTHFKQRLILRLLAAAFAAAILCPAAIAWGAARFGWHWTVLAAGVPAAGWLLSRSQPWIAARAIAALREPLAARLRQRGNLPVSNAAMVGFSPSGALRAYEGLYAWDLGFLFLTPDRLCYTGEQGAFAIPRSRIRSVELRFERVTWKALPVILVEADRPIQFLPAGAGSDEQARNLKEMLDAWRHCDASAPDWGPPQFGEVTAALPSALVSRDRLLLTLSLVTILAMAASTAFDLSYGGTAYTIATSNAVILWRLLPLLRYRDAKP